jgi:rubrerythrin
MDGEIESALREALLDEYANRLYYEALSETFGPSRQFDNLIRAEQRHVNALLNLFDRYGLEPPTQDEATPPTLPSTLREAIQIAVDEEEANVAMYDELLEFARPADVERVFTNLRKASAEHHIPSLKRALP